MFSVLLGLILCQVVAPRPSVILAPTEGPRRDIAINYYDESFLFASRDYGRASCGNTEPAFFVHSKQYKRWMRITKISTALGHFGTSRPENDPVSLKALSMAQADWDDRAYASRPYLDQPLGAGGFLSFPERFTFDPETGRYEMRYHSSWGIPAAETVLYIVKADLQEAFDTATQPPSQH